MNNKVYVRAIGHDLAPNTFFQMPRYYKFYNSYNKVINSNTILSIDGNGKNYTIETCVSKMEQTHYQEITEVQFNAMFNQHLSFLDKISKGEDISDEPEREGWEEIDAISRYE